MAIPLGRPLPTASRDLPGRLSGNGLRAVPIWSCSRWGLPCQFRYRTRGALLPHHFNLTSAMPKHRQIGGIISVALSLGFPPADVIRHRISVEPGLSSRQRALRGLAPTQLRRQAAIRPSDARTIIDAIGGPSQTLSYARVW